MAASPDPGVLMRAVRQLRDNVADLAFPLPTAGAQETRQVQERLVHQLDAFVLPRLSQRDAPVLVVVGGPTGSGKSSLVNGIAGSMVSKAGVLRPTTRGPVLVCHPDDVDAFADDRVLGWLRRTELPSQDVDTLLVMTSSAVPCGVALLDAPDIDSVVEDNRRLAQHLLDAADVWLFVFSAARYADAVPWRMLQQVSERGTSVSLVLDRVHQDDADEVTADLAGVTAGHGLSRVPLFVVPETDLQDGVLPAESVALVRGWLADMAGDHELRTSLVLPTLAGALDALGVAVTRLADEADAQAEARRRLRHAVSESYVAQVRHAQTALTDGSLLRGQVGTAWRRAAAAGRRGSGSRPRTVARMWDRVRSQPPAVPPLDAELSSAMQRAVADVVRNCADLAAHQAATTWQADQTGAALLEAAAGSTGRTFRRASPGLVDETRSAVHGWLEHNGDLVGRWNSRTVARAAGRSGRSGASRAGDRGVLRRALTVAACCTDPADGVAGPALSRLVASWGEPAGEAALEIARADLARRVEDLLTSERARFTGLLDTVPVQADAGELLRARLKDVREAR